MRAIFPLASAASRLRCLLPVGLAIWLGVLGGCSGDDTTVALPVGRYTTFQSASLVLGQSGFNTNTVAPIGPRAIEFPRGTPAVDDGRLILTDSFNNRVVVHNAFPTTNNAAADYAIGQPNLSSEAAAVTQTGLALTGGIVSDGTRLYLVDTGNSRVMIYDSIPTSSGAAADAVLGDTVFNSSTSGCSAVEMNQPFRPFIVGGKFLLSDSLNHRVLIWNTLPTSTAETPDIVLGQNSLTNCAANDRNQDGTPDIPNARTLDQPTGIWSNGVKLVISDTNNSRVLIWNSFPTTSFAPADIVLGQPDFSSNATGVGPDRFNLQGGVTSDGVQLFVADTINHRILIWSTFPTANEAPANIVLGQSTFTNVADNDDNQDGTSDGTPSDRTLNTPVGMTIVGFRLVVPDTVNHRYLIFEAQ